MTILTSDIAYISFHKGMVLFLKKHLETTLTAKDTFGFLVVFFIVSVNSDIHLSMMFFSFPWTTADTVVYGRMEYLVSSLI